MDHDRLFKDLLTTFFAEFIELFFPKMAAELDRDSIHFLDKEIFPDLNTGDRHEVDLLAKVRLSGRETFILIHVENQSTFQAEFPKRMFRYFSLLHSKFDLPIFPIALFSYDRPLKVAENRYEIELFETPILRFQFQAVQLNRLNWREFLSRPNPVANALMTKMIINPEDRPRVKLECLRMLATLKLDPARTELIGVFMESYLKLTTQEKIVYNLESKGLDPAESEITMEYVTEWHVQGRLDVINRILKRRFGELPLQLTDQISELPSEKLLDMVEVLLDFKTLEEVQAWIAGARLT